MRLKSPPSLLGTLPPQLNYPADRRYTPNRSSLYGRKWRCERVEHLAVDRYCVFCLARGDRTRAQVVDHTVPHKGNAKVFWNKADWQSLCKYDHDVIKQAMENKAGGDIELLRQLNDEARTAPGIPRR